MNNFNLKEYLIAFLFLILIIGIIIGLIFFFLYFPSIFLKNIIYDIPKIGGLTV